MGRPDTLAYRGGIDWVAKMLITPLQSLRYRSAKSWGQCLHVKDVLTGAYLSVND